MCQLCPSGPDQARNPKNLPCTNIKTDISCPCCVATEVFHRKNVLARLILSGREKSRYLPPDHHLDKLGLCERVITWVRFEPRVGILFIQLAGANCFAIAQNGNAIRDLKYFRQPV